MNATVNPDFVNMKQAAAVIGMAASTFRAILPVLVGEFGLRVYPVCGPKLSRADLGACMERLRESGNDLSVDKHRGVVRLGAQIIPISSFRVSRRGRRPKAASLTGGAITDNKTTSTMDTKETA